MNNTESILIGLVYSGFFSIDDKGRIWRHYKWINGNVGYRKFEKPKRGESRNIGYYMVSYRDGDKLYRAYSHRLVWIYFNGDIDSTLEINHKNGKRDDNRPGNLELVTPSENVNHAYRSGLAYGRPGEKHHNAHLTGKSVRRIRKMYSTGRYSQSRLGQLFGVGQTQVGRIIRRLRWRDV